MLAGGRSTRFGSNKLVAEHGGRPLLHHAVERVSAVCDEVVVVLAPGVDADDLPEGVIVAHDPTEGEGPLAGLHAGLLTAVRSELVVVAGGDMPDLQVAVLREMLVVARDTGVDAVALHDGEGMRPLPCVLRTWPAADAAHSLLHAGRRRLRDVLTVLEAAVVAEEDWVGLDPDRRTLFDVDVPGDLGTEPSG